MTTSTTRTALACALLATTCLSAPALAQTAQPSVHKNIDGNGVDLTDGSFNFSLTEGSIGTGEGALAMVRTFGRSGWTDGLPGRLHRTLSSTNNRISLTFGNRLEQFQLVSGIWTPDTGNGATLTGSGSDYIYRSADGVEVTYGVGGPLPGSPGGNGIQFCVDDNPGECDLLPLSVKQPNGRGITLHWNIAQVSADLEPTIGGTSNYFPRLTSVTNESAYLMKIRYATDSYGAAGPSPEWFRRTGVRFVNTTVEACDPAADDCVGLTRSWPTVSYAQPSPGVTQVTDIGGRTWEFTESSSSLAIRRPGSTANNVVVAKGTNGVTSVTADGVTTNYARTVAGATATTIATDALQHQRTVVSDLNIARPTRVTDELGQATNFAYDGNGRLTGVTAPEGNQVLTAYDARGNVTTTTAKAKPGSGLADIVTTAGYEAGCANAAICNQPLWTRDAAGNKTDFTYDAIGQVTSVTAPAPSAGAARPQMRYGYTPVAAAGGGSVSLLTSTSTCQTAAGCAGSADEVRTTVAYGTPNLHASQVSSGAGDGSLTASTAMTYDAVGNMVTVDGPLAGAADTSRTLYNASREVIGTIGPDPDGGGPLKHRAARTTYDAAGRAIVQESGTVTDQSDGAWSGFASLEQSNATYDANSRVVKRTLSAGGTTHAAAEYSYDAEGRLQCTAQRMNPASFGGLANACGLTAEGSFGPDRISRTVYDAADRVTTTQVAVGKPDEAVEASSTYSLNGKVATLTDGENNRTTYVYDGHDRRNRTLYPVATKGAATSSTTDFEELSYDGRSLVTSLRVRDGQIIGLSYDALSRPTLKNLPGTEPDVSYGYDNLGRLKSASQTGHALAFTYDALGRKLTESGPLGTVSSVWDIAGRRTRITHPNGFFVDQSYLTTGEMKQIEQPSSDPFSPPQVLASFAYDDLGRRTLLTRGNGTVTSYGYDPVSRLAQLNHDMAGTSHDLQLSFGYNPASQIASNTRGNDVYAWTGHGSGTTASPANGLNQLTALGNSPVGHDARGNITSDPSLGYSYSYSSENLLTGVNSGAFVGFSRYDPLMRLYESGVRSSTKVLYDGDARIAEYHSSGTQSARYVHGPGVDEPLVSYEGTGLATRRFLHADERGSIIAGSDDSGAVVGVNRYDEYGKGASTNFSRFQYTGQPYETLSELLYSRARMYNPRLGRFMQPDPIGYGDGMNLYGYVGNDPVNFTDPTGTKAVSCNSAETRLKLCDDGKGDAKAEVTLGRQPESSGDGSSGGKRGVKAKPKNGDGSVNAAIPSPPPNLPGGPYTAKPPTRGNREGSFQGPRQPTGPRSQAQWVPSQVEGGPPGSRGYWKVQSPGQQGFDRFNQNGKYMTPNQAHPNSNGSRSFFFLGPVGAVLCALFCESPAY